MRLLTLIDKLLPMTCMLLYSVGFGATRDSGYVDQTEYLGSPSAYPCDCDVHLVKQSVEAFCFFFGGFLPFEMHMTSPNLKPSIQLPRMRIVQTSHSTKSPPYTRP